MSIKSKLTILFLAVAFIPTLLVVAISFQNYRNSIENTELAALQHLTSYKAEIINTYFDGLKDNIKIAQSFYNIKKNLPILTQFANDPNNPEFIAAKKILDRQLQPIQEALNLHDILLLNQNGQIVYLTNPAQCPIEFLHPLADPDKQAFERGKHNIYFGNIFSKAQNDNKLVMLATAPVSDFNDAFIGVIAFEIDMAPIYTLLQDVTGLGKTGETLIGRKTGNQVEFLNPLRHDPNAALRRKVTLGDSIGYPIQQAAQGKTGAGITVDYRGKKVIAAWRYIPSLDWGLVAKIDASEAFGDIANLQKLITIILFLIFVLTTLMAFSIARSIAEPVRKLAEGAAIIGSGDLDFKVGIDSNDEIGHLSRSFDKMTRDLKTTTTSRDELNREVARRMRTEEELRTSHTSLELQNIELRKTQEALRESQADLSRAQAVALVGSWRLNIQNNELTWSDEAYRIFGIPKGTAMTYESFLACVHPDDRTYVDQKWNAALTGEPYDIEHRILVDDQIKWIREKAELEFDKNDNLIGAFGTCQDITERKQAEQALRESRHDLDRAQAVAATGSWRLDVRKNELRWSDENHRIFGIPKGTKMTYETFLSVVHPDDRNFVDKKWKAALEGEPYDIEHRIVVGGKVKWVREIAEIEFDKDGKLLGGFGITQDITERKRSEAERESTIEFLRIVNGSTNTRALIRAATTFFQQQFGCEAVGIRLKQGDDYPYYETRGFPKKFVLSENSLCAKDLKDQLLRDDIGNPILECMCGNVIQGRFDPSKPFFTKRGSFWTNCATELLDASSETNKQAHIRNRCTSEGYESVALIALRVGQEILGLLQLNDRRKDQFTPELISLWERLADHLAVAIAKFRAEDDLRKLTEELEQRVKERTEQLTHTVETLEDEVRHRLAAEKDLKQSEERYRSLTLATTQIVWTTASNGEVISDLPLWREFTGQTVDEIQGWGWINALHPDDRDRTAAIWSEAVRSCSLYQTEYRIRRRDGEYRYVAVRGVPVMEEDGCTIREWVGTCTDITDRKIAQQRQAVTSALLELFARKESRKEYLDSTVEAIRQWSDCNFVGIRIKDKDGNIPYESHVGFDEDFLALESNLNLCRDHCVCIRSILSKPQPHEKFLITEGNSFYCNDSQAFLNGLTEQQKKEYRGNCMKKGFQSIAVVPIRYRDEVYGAIHLADFKKDMVLLPKVQFIESTIAPLIGEAIQRFNAEAELDKYRTHLEELVAQRTQELEKEIAQRKLIAEDLARSNKDLEQFAYVASHDLQEPLRAVAGFVELLRMRLEKNLDDKGKEYMNHTVEGVKRMQNLINGLLEYSRIGTRGKKPELVDSKAALDRALAHLHMSISESGAEIIAGQLPKVNFDPVQLAQLFQNLISNAIKFRSEKTPQIRITAEHQDTQWKFAVADNGIGIEPQYADRIFLIFQRLHSRVKYPGTGIGLALCKKIVERHGGKIWVESKPGAGSTFYFTIPDIRETS